MIHRLSYGSNQKVGSWNLPWRASKIKALACFWAKAFLFFHSRGPVFQIDQASLREGTLVRFKPLLWTADFSRHQADSRFPRMRSAPPPVALCFQTVVVANFSG